jgi:hypothetical protein
MLYLGNAKRVSQNEGQTLRFDYSLLLVPKLKKTNILSSSHKFSHFLATL